jgi:hypothetical protein
MVHSIFPQASEQTPVRAALLSLAPFLVAGPLMVVVSYHPWWDPAGARWTDPLAIGAISLLISLGFGIGAMRRFPRWSYPYAFYLLMLLIFAVTYLVNGTPWDINHEPAVALAVIAAAALVMTAVPALRPFYANVRRDWTLLSYGLFAFSMIIFCTQDRDVSPRLTFLVLLPSLITLAGAFLYLRLASTAWRIAALLASTLLGGLVWIVPLFDTMIGSMTDFIVSLRLLLTVWGALGGLLIVPALIAVFTRPRLAA